MNKIDFGPHINAHSGHSSDSSIHPWVEKQQHKSITVNPTSSFAVCCIIFPDVEIKSCSGYQLLGKGVIYSENT